MYIYVYIERYKFTYYIYVYIYICVYISSSSQALNPQLQQVVWQPERINYVQFLVDSLFVSTDENIYLFMCHGIWIVIDRYMSLCLYVHENAFYQPGRINFILNIFKSYLIL
jgi:hypothetical protein